MAWVRSCQALFLAKGEEITEEGESEGATKSLYIPSVNLTHILYI